MLHIIIFIIYAGIPMKQIQNKCAVILNILKNIFKKINVTDLDLIISVLQLATPVGLNFLDFCRKQL